MGYNNIGFRPQYGYRAGAYLDGAKGLASKRQAPKTSAEQTSEGVETVQSEVRELVDVRSAEGDDLPR